MILVEVFLQNVLQPNSLSTRGSSQCMCIFHVLMVRGLSGSEGASAPCMGLPGNAEVPPGYAPDCACIVFQNLILCAHLSSVL